MAFPSSSDDLGWTNFGIASYWFGLNENSR